MASVDYAAISGVLNKRFEPQLQSHINRSVPLLRLLAVKRSPSQVIQWVNTFSQVSPTTGAMADGADWAGYNSDLKVNGTLDFTTYHDAFKLTGRAIAGAAAAGNPEQVANLFAEELMEGLQRLCAYIGDDIYSGTGASNRMLGITGTAGGLRAAGTYAGVNRATYTEFAGNELANGGVNRSLTLALMRSARKAAFDACGFKFDLAISNSAIHDVYAEILGDRRRFVEETTMRGRKVRLDGGFDALDFDGIPFIKDVNAPANSILFLNSQYIDVWYLPQGPMPPGSGAAGERNLEATEEEQLGGGSVNLPARIQPSAVTGDAFPFGLVCYPQVRVKRPGAHAYLKDLLES
jgi:hypothetical protein